MGQITTYLFASNGENKSLTAQTTGARLTLKDDKNTLIFDRED